MSGSCSLTLLLTYLRCLDPISLAHQAQRLALQGGGSADGGVQASYVLVQSYVQRQFMYEQRPSYLRLWAVVTGVQPLRVYLFRGGVLVFGDPVGSSRGGSGAGSGAGGGRRWGWGSAGRRVLLAQQEEEEEQAEDAEAGNGGVSAGDGLPVVQRSGGEQQRRRRLSQQAGGGGGGTAGGRYEMHQVNYWTIAGRKMAPWTLSQLREHISKALPDDPRVFDRMWGQARASVGMVLAAGSGAMRGAARRLAALEGSGESHAGKSRAARVAACVVRGWAGQGQARPGPGLAALELEGSVGQTGRVVEAPCDRYATRGLCAEPVPLHALPCEQALKCWVRTSHKFRV